MIVFAHWSRRLRCVKQDFKIGCWGCFFWLRECWDAGLKRFRVERVNSLADMGLWLIVFAQHKNVDPLSKNTNMLEASAAERVAARRVLFEGLNPGRKSRTATNACIFDRRLPMTEHPWPRLTSSQQTKRQFWEIRPQGSWYLVVKGSV